MKTFRMLTLAVALALCSVTSSHAGPKILATAPALAAYPNLQNTYCDIISLNTGSVNVTIDIMDYFGNVILTSGSQAVLPNSQLSTR